MNKLQEKKEDISGINRHTLVDIIIYMFTNQQNSSSVSKHTLTLNE